MHLLLFSDAIVGYVGLKPSGEVGMLGYGTAMEIYAHDKADDQKDAAISNVVVTEPDWGMAVLAR